MGYVKGSADGNIIADRSGRFGFVMSMPRLYGSMPLEGLLVSIGPVTKVWLKFGLVGVYVPLPELIEDAGKVIR